MPEMKTLNGYEVVDAKARQDIKGIQAAVEAIPEYDLTPYATKSELPTKVSQLQNDSKFITLEEVPETDLSEYAKKTDIPDVSGFITSIPSEYITESELNAKGYLTAEDLPESIDTSKFLTKVDNNDQYMWYATTTNANQVIQNYVPIEKLDSKLDVVVGGKTLNNNTIAVREGLQIRVPEAPTNAGHAASKAYVDKAIAAIPEVDLSSYAKKTDIPDVSGFISEIPSEYVTDSELAAKGYLVEADLSEYAKKTEIPTVPTKTSQLTNDSNFLTAVPSEYVTETELDNKGYLTQHQSLEGYATKTYVDDAIAGNGSIVYLDIRSIGTSYEPAPQEAITLAKDLLAGKSLIVYLRISDTEYRQADIKCDTSSVELFAAPKINAHNGDATQGICVIQDFGSNGVEDWHAYKAIDISPALITQSELDNAIAGIDIPKVFFLDFSTATSIDQAATETMVAFANYFKNNDNVSVYMRDSFGSDYYYPAVIQKIGTYTFNFLKASGNLNDVASNGALNWDTIRIYSNDNGATWKYTKLATRSTTIATKSYVDEAIAGIDIPGGSGKKVLNLRIGSSLTASEKAIVNEILEYLRTGASDVMSKYEVTFRSPDSNRGAAYLVTGLHDLGANRLRVYGQASNNGTISYFYTDLYSDTNSSNVSLLYTDDILHLCWKQASGLNDSELYSATEIYVLGSDFATLDSCYAYLKTNSGPGTEFGGAQCIPLVSYRGDNSATSLAESNMPYMDWQGWGFNAHNFSVVAVFYKS